MSHFTPQALRARETATLYLIAVRVSAGRLVIESAKPERAPPAEILAKIARVAEGGSRSGLWLESCPDTSSCRSRQHLPCLGPCGPCGLRGPLSRFAVHRGAALKRVNGCPFCRLRRAGHSPRVTSRPLGGRHVVRAADIISRSANRRKGQDDSHTCRRTPCFTAHATPPWLACADVAQMAHTSGVTRLRARSNVADALVGMAWFNGLSRSERAYWLDVAGSACPAAAWAAFQSGVPGP